MIAFLIDELLDTEAGSQSRSRGLIYATCFTVAIVVKLTFMHSSYFIGSVGFMKMRKVLTALLYSKILTLSLHSVAE